jgi:signal transduction histidine kinase
MTSADSAADSRWQRWWCAGLDADARAEAQALQQRLAGRDGLWLAAALAAGLAAAAWGLRSAGVPLAWALLVALLFVAGSALAMRRAWLQPERFDARTLRRLALLMLVATYAGALGGMAPGLWATDPGGRVDQMLSALWRATPAQLVAGLALLLLLWVVAAGRRAQMQRALAQSRLEAERDAAARAAAEARLKLLQAQIQPHFLFNTLAALQHWVDMGDARAAPLLRALTGFLRGSTELMARDVVTLADELPLAHHYLDIMRARLGADRLAMHFDIEPACMPQPLPPALLLTLLENAIEHGITPSLHGGRVDIRAQRLAAGCFELSVADSGVGLAPGWHDGVGLANARERLMHRFGPAAHLELQPLERGTLARILIEPPENDIAQPRAGDTLHAPSPPNAPDR